MNSFNKFILIFALTIVFWVNSTRAQSFYNFDNFLADSAFVLNNKIKSVTIRIPTLLDDSTNKAKKEFIPYQKMCFNPFGKLATYEFDFSEKNRTNIDYLEHYYNDTTKLCYKSHRFRRAQTGKDTLREEINYKYDETLKLFFEEHHQKYISEFNEWTIGYEWYGDTLRIRYAENSKIDTTRFDEKGRVSEFTELDKLYKIAYDSLGRKSRMSYFLLNNEYTKNKKIGEYTFVYDAKGKLESIQTMGHEIVFTYDFMGLPLSSQMRDKRSGQALGWQVMYEYDYRW